MGNPNEIYETCENAVWIAESALLRHLDTQNSEWYRKNSVSKPNNGCVSPRHQELATTAKGAAYNVSHCKTKLTVTVEATEYNTVLSVG